MDILIIVFKILGSNSLLLVISIVSHRYGKRLVNHGATIIETGIEPAHSWEIDRPPTDVKIPKIVGGYVLFCGLAAYFFSVCAILSILIIDILILGSL